MSSPRIVVSGFLGAGKSHLVTRLQSLGASCVEKDGVDPMTSRDLAVPVVTVVDGANFSACLQDPDIAPLIQAQVAAASVVLISRADVADVSSARAALSEFVNVPVIVGEDADLGSVLADLSPKPLSMAKGDAPTVACSTWTYEGSAVLTQDALDAFLAARPKGAYRIEGRVRGASKGIEVQVFGRGRQTSGTEQPADTSLKARGLASRFRPSDMDLAFSEAVIASSYRRGVIACR